LIGQVVPANERLGAEPILLYAIRIFDRGHHRGAGHEAPAHLRGYRIPPQKHDRAFQETHEPLRTRIDDARRREHRKELWSALQRVVGPVEHMLGERSDVLDLCTRNRPGRVSHDRENRTFYRFLERLGEVLDAGLQGTTEIGRVDPTLTLQAPSETQEKVGKHHAAVPPGPKDGRLRRFMRHPTNGSFGTLFEMIGDGLHGEVQVRARIPVRHREDVDAVELLTLLLRPLATRDEGPPEPRTIDIADLHLARSTLTRARATDRPRRGHMHTRSNRAILGAMSELTQMRCEACQRGAPQVTAGESRTLHTQVPDWALVERDGIQRLERAFAFPGFADALAFTNRVGALAEAEGHHPALLTEWGSVTVTWWTHKIRGLHQNDFIMAAKTDQLAPED